MQVKMGGTDRYLLVFPCRLMVNDRFSARSHSIRSLTWKCLSQSDMHSSLAANIFVVTSLLSALLDS
jgi:hypothetical protein